jgi:hypothetical protein
MKKSSRQIGRLPPIILTPAAKLLQLQKKLRGFVKGNYEFRNTKNGTTVVTKVMADFLAIKFSFHSENISVYTSFPKSQKTVKTITRYLLSNTPAEICEALMELYSDITSIK